MTVLKWVITKCLSIINISFLTFAKDVQNLSPATDFYKKFALDCAAEQVAVDIFLLSGQYADIATLSKCVTVVEGPRV